MVQRSASPKLPGFLAGVSLTFAGLALVALGVGLTPEARAVQGGGGSGKQVFESNRCGTCHSVSTAGIEARMQSGPMAGGDLVGKVERRGAGWVRGYITGQETLNGKTHSGNFKGSDEELATLVDWLGKQRR